MERVSLILLL